jgi:hypothetical protein
VCFPIRRGSIVIRDLHDAGGVEDLAGAGVAFHEQDAAEALDFADVLDRLGLQRALVNDRDRGSTRALKGLRVAGDEGGAIGAKWTRTLTERSSNSR